MFLVETNMTVVEIEDLGLTVRRDQPVWISPKQRSSSLCLKKLRQLGHVRVVPKQASREEKPVPPKRRKRPPKPWRVSNASPKKTSVETPVPSGGAAPTPRQVYTQREVELIASRAAQEAAQRVLDAQAPATPLLDLQGLEERVERVVERVVGEALKGIALPSTEKPAPQKRAEKTSSSGPEEPQYIPKDIVKPEAAPVLETSTESSSSSGVEDAAKALKKTRGTRHKKQKETTS